MSLVGGIVSFVIIWTVVLFTVLPWGNRPPDEPGDGHAPSAPENPRIALKFAVTTAIATALFVVLYIVMANRLISLPAG